MLRISKIQTFESNSQLKPYYYLKNKGCSEYQRYKLLKAIHNLEVYMICLQFVAQNIKDTNFWKQFTTPGDGTRENGLLLRISKIQTFESNSQPDEDICRMFLCCSEYQRYKLLKAIHNNFNRAMEAVKVAQNIKDTNFWKQFTTTPASTRRYLLLLRISKIQTFESNSQHQSNMISAASRCSEYQRYKLLKAIHNMSLWLSPRH